MKWTCVLTRALIALMAKCDRGMRRFLEPVLCVPPLSRTRIHGFSQLTHTTDILFEASFMTFVSVCMGLIAHSQLMQSHVYHSRECLIWLQLFSHKYFYTNSVTAKKWVVIYIELDFNLGSCDWGTPLH